jgi:hypothetical protein
MTKSHCVVVLSPKLLWPTLLQHLRVRPIAGQTCPGMPPPGWSLDSEPEHLASALSHGLRCPTQRQLQYTCRPGPCAGLCCLQVLPVTLSPSGNTHFVPGSWRLLWGNGHFVSQSPLGSGTPTRHKDWEGLGSQAGPDPTLRVWEAKGQMELLEPHRSATGHRPGQCPRMGLRHQERRIQPLALSSCSL